MTVDTVSLTALRNYLIDRGKFQTAKMVDNAIERIYQQDEDIRTLKAKLQVRATLVDQIANQIAVDTDQGREVVGIQLIYKDPNVRTQ